MLRTELVRRNSCVKLYLIKKGKNNEKIQFNIYSYGYIGFDTMWNG